MSEHQAGHGLGDYDPVAAALGNVVMVTDSAQLVMPHVALPKLEI